MFETRLKLLPVATFIEFPGRTLQLLGRDISTFFGCELEGSPIGLALGAFVELVKVIKAMRRADEQRTAVPVG